jgi:hypothetical protein
VVAPNGSRAHAAPAVLYDVRGNPLWRESVDSPGTYGLIVVNADGTAVGGGGVGGSVAVTSIAPGDTNIGNVDVLSSALPTGAATAANQTPVIASLDVLDDWDETDRAKVNLIVGQAGISGGAGTAAANTPRVTIASNDAAVTSLSILDDALVADDNPSNLGSIKVTMAGFAADEVATDSVDEGDAGAARMTLDRKQIVTLQPHTAGGCIPFTNIDVDETEDVIKASAGQLYELYLYNATAAPLYVKLYDATVATVVVGTTTPTLTIPVPGNGDADGAGVVRNWPTGLRFATAITIAATTGVADTDVGAPAANALIASGAYL